MILSIYACQLYLDEFGGDKGVALDYAKNLGISTVEVFDDELSEAFTLHDYRMLVEAHGLTISNVLKVSTFPDGDEAHYESEMASIKALVDEVDAEGIPMMMVVPLSKDVKDEETKRIMRDRIMRGMNEALAYAQNTGVMLIGENFGKEIYPVCTIDEMRYYMESVPGLHINLDPANFFFGHCDELEAYEALKDRIVDIHLKDWKYTEDGPYEVDGKRLIGCTIGEGFIQCKELIERLKKDGYQGSIMIEFNPGAEDLKMIEDSVAFVKEVMESWN